MVRPEWRQADAATVAGLSTEQRVVLTRGADFWSTESVDGAPGVVFADGPHGLRRQTGAVDHLGLAGSAPATCFPTAGALASSFDPELAERIGVALGREAASQGVDVLLAPAINIKRSPLGGRNFEYFSEDPIVSGVLGAAMVRGIQSQGVGASLKHFAANNQETDRLRVSSDVDPRPLREIYLRGFQRVVEDSRPWTVMCAYNRINGVYASEDHELLTHILRDEWGFDGVVLSDWGAVRDRVAAIAAGLDLEMPSPGPAGDEAVLAAIRNGSLDEDVLTAAAERVVALARRAAIRSAPDPVDSDGHHALAREAAASSIVLLKNDGGILPLPPEARLGVIGALAAEPRYQGSGSSRVNATRIDAALDCIRELAGGEVGYARGYLIDGVGDATALAAEAVELAESSDVVIVFLGLLDSSESEGFDRASLDLPSDQLAVLDAVLAANPRTVVVLANGGVVTLPFAERVPAILETWLLGQGGGHALADVVYGRENPSGKLAESIPTRIEDTAAYGNFPGSFGHVRYGEGILVGYRWYDQRKIEVAFPFGHGLSYTTFSYGDLTALTDDQGCIELVVPVTNTGGRAGREIVQFYSSLLLTTIERPPRELKAFVSVRLDPGETRVVRARVRRADIAYWDIRASDWLVEGGVYSFQAGASSRDIRSAVSVAVEGDRPVIPLTLDSSISEVLANPAALDFLTSALEASSGNNDGGFDLHDEQTLRVIGSFPIGRITNFPGVRVRPEVIAEVLARANAAGKAALTPLDQYN